MRIDMFSPDIMTACQVEIGYDIKPKFMGAISQIPLSGIMNDKLRLASTRALLRLERTMNLLCH